MGRSVSYPTGARVVYRDVREMDHDEWDEFLDWLRAEGRRAWPSMEERNWWLGREDRVLLENALACFGVSEYCGLAAVWIVAKDPYLDRLPQSFADAWVDRAAAKLERLFGEYRLMGRASNGEAFYTRIAEA